MLKMVEFADDEEEEEEEEDEDAEHGQPSPPGRLTPKTK